MPVWIVPLVEYLVPQLLGVVIRHYERKEERDEAEEAKLQCHKDALESIREGKDAVK